MRTEEPKDPLKGMDWKAIGGDLQKDPSAKPIVKKRLPRKIRQILDYYFLPRRSLPSTIAFYGACIAGGIGAGMLLETWINKKVEGRYYSHEADVLLSHAQSGLGRQMGTTIYGHVLVYFMRMEA